MTSTHRRWLSAGAIGAGCLLAAAMTAPAATAAEPDGLAGSELYLNPYSTTLEAGQSLEGQARADAQLLGSIPSAEWFTSGTPAEVQDEVSEYVDAAEAAGQVPVLVAYNLPFRDCAQYSSGGAFDTAEYTAWIDAFAAGIGDRQAAVILEPDGLGIIPWYTNIDGTLEWCQPAELDSSTAADDRFTQLNHAVDAFAALPHTSAYLDATHTGWLNVGDASDRLIKAGVDRAAGFFLNASNYQLTPNLEAYGRWVSSCITLVSDLGGGFGDCGNQYWNGGPATNWDGTAMDTTKVWSNGAESLDQNTAGIDSRYDAALGGTEPTTHFVIDTSRNGQGPWTPPEGVYSDPEDWCNPPDRGLGLLPTTDTGVDLLDAYLWIKVPGESDGQCYRGTGGPLDPERGIEDPAAGQWFVEQARELLELAAVPIPAQTCHIDWTVHGSWPKGFNTQIWVENIGDSSISGWDLTWTFQGEQTIRNLWSGDETQTGAAVSVENLRYNGSIAPGKRTTLGFIGTGGPTEPWLFHLNGQPCTSS